MRRGYKSAIHFAALADEITLPFVSLPWRVCISPQFPSGVRVSGFCVV